MMTRREPFLGETTDRREAMGLDALRLIVIKQWRYEPEQRFTKATMPRHLKCANPRCRQGGLDLQEIVINWGSMQRTFYCSGHEGSPKGRRKGDPCTNSFEVTLEKD
jgi:hypothetical protein